MSITTVSGLGTYDSPARWMATGVYDSFGAVFFQVSFSTFSKFSFSHTRATIEISLFV